MHKVYRQYPATYSHVLEYGIKLLRDASVPNPGVDARALLSEVRSFSRKNVFFGGKDIISEIELEKYSGYLERRLLGEPVAYIIGKKEFWSLDFAVNRSTLIPRPDSETLVEAVINYLYEAAIPNPKILDLGTGTGCLLISILSEFPEALGFGVDIDEAASNIARNNAIQHGLQTRALFYVGNWGEAFRNGVDIIISNPPYVANDKAQTLSKDIIEFEPNIALFAGSDGLNSYREIVCGLDDILVPGGRIFVEIGFRQSQKVKRIFKNEGYMLMGSWSDLAGIERCVGFRAPK
ncbi:MAG: protein-(glutamine-N5) methyltransferase, release factor-specific [Rhodospirillaceae bacterium]|nr:protein-(glutamine-N5) methyltransferase, release factor-specific [Rhodospirillaceae bacterium]